MGNHGGEPSSAMTQQITTTFVDDADVVRTTFPKVMSGVTGLSVSAVDEPSIRSFLAKPYLVSSYFWTASDVINTPIMTYITANATGVPAWQAKLLGYNLFRGTFKVKLVINAQPFQAGRLLMSVLPFVQASPLSYEAAHTVDLTQRTQAPNVELDCRDTSAEIEIPWVGPDPWMNVNAAILDWGKIYVSPLSVLATGTSGSTGVEVQMFISILNAEFAAPLVPQSGDKPKRRTQKLSSEAEQEAIAQGKPISTALKYASRAAEAVAGVPLLSSIARPASWVLRASSDLASAFGWSKPNLTTPAQFMVLRPFHNFGNCEGTSQAEPLAITADPSVSVLPGFAGTDIDEMSWNYIKSVPAYLTTFTFSTSANVGDSLYKKAVGPLLLYNQYSNGLGTPATAIYRTFPPFAYVTNAFGRYRGGIKVIFKIVKTDYHSGRLLITWSPKAALGTDPTNATSVYSMRTIVDIREVTEVEMTLPYMLQSAWQQFDLDMGTLQVRVLNTLQAPNTVNSSIDVLVYYAGAEDYEVAISNNPSLTPYTPQSGDKPNTKAVGVIGNDTSTIPMIEEYSIGEKFTSVKQLISRYSRCYFDRATMDTCVGFRMYPWGVGYLRTATTLLTNGCVIGDMYSFIAAGYGLARGGMRISINISNSVFSQVDYSRQIFDLMEAGASCTMQYAGATLAGGFTNSSANISNIWTKPGVASATGTMTTANPAIFVQSPNGIEVLLPQFTNNPSRLNVCDVDSTTKVSSNYLYNLVSYMALQWQENSSTVTNKSIYRAAAEDAQLGYFIGFPAIVVQVT